MKISTLSEIKQRSIYMQKVLKFGCALVVGSTVVFGATTNNEETKAFNKKNVISQLRSMIDPAGNTTAKLKQSNAKPYLKIIPSDQGRSTLIYRCRNTNSKSLIDSIESVVSKVGIVEESTDENLIIVNDISSKMDELKKLILALDVTAPQILVEAKIIEVYMQDQFDRQLEWDVNKGTPVAGGGEGSTGGLADFRASGSQPDVFSFTPFTSGISGSFGNFHFLMNWLQTVNDAKILSSPNLAVSLGSTGSIVTGEDLPIPSTSFSNGATNTSISYKRTGITLKVTPVRINDDIVRLEVSPEVSTVTRTEKIAQNDQTTDIPVVSVRNVKTELNVKNGEIIMLGGLYSSEEIATEKKIPYLGDIPYLGWFFRAESNSTALKQLIFFLKVTVIDSGDETFVDLEGNAESLQKTSDALKSSDKIFPKTKEESEKTDKPMPQLK